MLLTAMHAPSCEVLLLLTAVCHTRALMAATPVIPTTLPLYPQIILGGKFVPSSRKTSPALLVLHPIARRPSLQETRAAAHLIDNMSRHLLPKLPTYRQGQRPLPQLAPPP